MRRLVRRAGCGDRTGLLGNHPFVDEFVDHFGAGLRALAEGRRRLRTDSARLGLTRAEVAHVGYGRGCGSDGIEARSLRRSSFVWTRRSAEVRERRRARTRPLSRRTWSCPFQQFPLPSSPTVVVFPNAVSLAPSFEDPVRPRVDVFPRIWRKSALFSENSNCRDLTKIEPSPAAADARDRCRQLAATKRSPCNFPFTMQRCVHHLDECPW